MIESFKYFRPTLRQCFLIFLLPIIAQFVFSPIVLISNLTLKDYSILREIIEKPLIYILSFIPCIIYIVKMGKRQRNRTEILNELSEPIPLNRPDFGKIHPLLFFLLLAIAMIALAFAIDPLMSIMPTPDWFHDLIEAMVGGNIYISLFTVGICAALFEELVFRGTIERGLLSHSSATKAILWSAVFFALVHMNPWQAVPAFIFGIFFGWIYYRTHCLWATIFMHFVNNTMTTVLSYLYPGMNDIDSYQELFPSQDIYLMVYAISIGILALTFFIISRYTSPVKSFKQDGIKE